MSRIVLRTVKPVAAGLLVSVLTLGRLNLDEDGLLTDTFWAHALVAVALLTGAALILGWVRDSSVWLRVGMALTMFLFLTRIFFILLVVGWHAEDEVFFSLGIALIAGGSFVLEQCPPRRGDR